MITRLMLSLRKAASTKGGRSFTQMATPYHTGHNLPIQFSSDMARARDGFRSRGMGGSTDNPEAIVMVSTEILEEPR